jgi:hypothetical protein
MENLDMTLLLTVAAVLGFVLLIITVSKAEADRRVKKAYRKGLQEGRMEVMVK